jgi:hypothetical protein
VVIQEVPASTGVDIQQAAADSAAPEEDAYDIVTAQSD